MEIQCGYQLLDKQAGQVVVKVKNLGKKPLELRLEDQAYKNPTVTKSLGAGKTLSLGMDTRNSYGWYDCSLVVEGHRYFGRRFAGRVEFGQHSKRDPLMGGVV